MFSLFPLWPQGILLFDVLIVIAGVGLIGGGMGWQLESVYPWGCDVAVSVEVIVGGGVEVGLNNCPDPQAKITTLTINKKKIAFRWFIFIFSPALSRARPATVIWIAYFIYRMTSYCA